VLPEGVAESEPQFQSHWLRLVRMSPLTTVSVPRLPMLSVAKSLGPDGRFSWLLLMPDD
jgi:hypothetical protein